MKKSEIKIYDNQDIDYSEFDRTQERVDLTGEIFTPEEIVNKMLDEVRPEDWSNPDITILEPSCGDGNFVVKIIERFMIGLENIIPDREARFKHIIEKQVYALDIMPDNINATLNRIDSIFGYTIRNLDHNILYKDTIGYDCAFGNDWTDEYGFHHTAEPKHKEENKIIKDVKKKKITVKVADLSEFKCTD